VVDLNLFKIASYSYGVSVNLLYFAGFTPLFFVFTLYLQIGIKYSALAAGLAITPFAVGSGVAAALGGRVVHRYGRPLVAVGLVVVAAGLALTILAVHEVPRHGTGWATLSPLLLAGLGSGLVITPNQTLTLSEIPVPRAGTAGGVMQTGQRIGAAIGIAAVGAVFFADETSSHDFAGAFQRAVLVAVAFVVAALVLAVVDIVTHRGAQSAEPSPDIPAS
jgi:MFS family permease